MSITNRWYNGRFPESREKKIEAFVRHVLEECEQEGFTIDETTEISAELQHMILRSSKEQRFEYKNKKFTLKADDQSGKMSSSASE